MGIRRNLAEALALQALRNPVRIGQRQIINFGDTASQTVGAGATVVTSFNTSLSIASAPAFAVPGTDIIVGADQAVLLEAIGFSIDTPDAAGKLKIVSAWIKARAVLLLPINCQGNPLPYAFAPSNSDYFTCVADLVSPYQLDRPQAEFIAQNHNYYVQFGATVVNTDGAAAHSYQRNVVFQYRLIDGIDPIDVLDMMLDTDR